MRYSRWQLCLAVEASKKNLKLACMNIATSTTARFVYHATQRAICDEHQRTREIDVALPSTSICTLARANRRQFTPNPLQFGAASPPHTPLFAPFAPYMRIKPGAGFQVCVWLGVLQLGGMDGWGRSLAAVHTSFVPSTALT